MKRNLTFGIAAILTAIMSSCATQNKFADAQNSDNDDVYYTKTIAGIQSFYASQANYNNSNDGGYEDGYDDAYYPSIPAYSGFYFGAYDPLFAASFGFNDIFGGYGYDPFWGYSNNGYYGSTIGYGVAPYWGTVSYYSSYGHNSYSPHVHSYREAFLNNNTYTRPRYPGAYRPPYFLAHRPFPNTNPNQRGPVGYQPQQQQQRPQSTTPPPASSGSSVGGVRTNGSSRPGRP